MKRLHVALTVRDLQQSVAFYTALFGAEPTARKDDYAKWLLDDPRVNLSITQNGGTPGIEHLGIQAEDEGELQNLYAGVREAEATMREEGHTTCCYAQSEKSWVRDPQDVEWELFHTYGESETFYGEAASTTACCDDTCCDD